MEYLDIVTEEGTGNRRYRYNRPEEEDGYKHMKWGYEEVPPSKSRHL
ncbi:MAG: hypothetical protein K6B14_02710 [Lachnospiraceae bacterium]|nr:hypothetical protein [Lachnospiraceae bacterium]